MKTIQQLQARADDLKRLNDVIEEVQGLPYIFKTDDQDQEKIDDIVQWLDMLHSRFLIEMNRELRAWVKENKAIRSFY